jgi:hypothetical protein
VSFRDALEVESSHRSRSYLHVCIDDHSRLADAELLADECAESAATNDTNVGSS